MKHGRHILALVALLAASLPAWAAEVVTASTGAFRLDLRPSPRVSAGTETLTFSPLWDGGDTAAIALDGTPLGSWNAEGDFLWTTNRAGTYSFSHTATLDGIAAGEPLAASFTIPGPTLSISALGEMYPGVEIAISGADTGWTIHYTTDGTEPTANSPAYAVPFPIQATTTVRAVAVSTADILSQEATEIFEILWRPFTTDDITVTDFSSVYDGTGHGIGVACDIAEATVKYADSEAGPYGDSPILFTNAVENAMVWCVVEAPFYLPVTNSATVTITQRPVSVAAEPKSKVYGQGDPALTYTVDGLVAGESLSGALGRDSGENVGTYEIRKGTLAASANYSLSFTGATFTISKATMPGTDAIAWGVSGAAARFTYDGVEHSVALTGLPSGVTVTYVGNIATNAGDYTATAHLVYDTANYEPIADPAPLAWGIDRRPAMVRSASATWTYDTTTHTKAEVAAEGFVAGEGVTARDFASVTDITPATGVANTFAYDWNAGTHAENYALTVEFGTLKVTPRIIGDDPANWDIRLGKNPTYDGTEKSAPVAQVCYVKPDGNLENIPYTLSGDKATDAGNYVLTITGTGNYAGSVERGWAVMPRHLTLASGSATWTYDGAAHSETAVTVGGDGFAPGEGADYSGFPAPTHVADAAAPGIENAFTWTFRDGAKAGNYEVVATFGTVAVTPRAVTLTAPTKTKPYDGMPLTFGAEEILATLTDGAPGGRALPEGESFAYSNFAAITDAGQCAATFTIASGTALTGDYAITVAEGATLTVTRSAAEIVVQAGSETWTYDGAAHSNRTWTATNLDTLVAGDELSVEFEPDSVVTRPTDGPALDGVVSNRIASVRVLRGGVGSADSVDVTANYALSWYPGTLRVTPRPVSLTSASATKPYDGTPLVAHEVSVGGDGFVGTDGATFSFTGSQTEKGESANTFSWTLKPGTVAAHYEITAVEGTLAVTALDIGGGTNGDWTVELGPALTYNGIEQLQTVRAATFRGLPVDYAVEDDRGTDAGSYALTLVGQGNFTGRWTVPWSIAPKALALAAGSASKVYDGTPLTCGDVTATGFVAGEGAQFICAGSRTSVGTSTNAVDEILWDDGTKGSNYAVEKTEGTLTVTPRPVTLTAPTKTKPYDGLPLTFGADEIMAALTDGAGGGRALPEGESFAYSDFSAITDAGQCAATFAVAAGLGTDLANYTVTIAPGSTLTVTGSATEITVIADSASWVFDATTHSAPTYTTVNEDTLQPGDALAVEFENGCEVTHTTDGPAGDGVVTNRIASVRVMRGGETDVTRNYTLKTYDGTLRVTKRPAEVRVTGNRVEAVYDAAEHVAEGYGITTDDTLYNLADVAFSGTARAARTDAGTTTMGLATDDFSNTNADFAVTFAVADGNVAVSPADISGGDDGDFVVELGDDPLYNGTVQTVEIRSVAWKGLPVDHTLAGERATHAATYALTVKGTGNFTGERTVRWGIRRRAVTMTSGSAEKVYDATPLRNGAVAVSGDGFIGSEGATYDVTGSQTLAGSSDNTFSYTLKAGTLAGDYDVATVFGTLTVHKATHDTSRIAWNVSGAGARFTYDGAEHGVALTGLPSGVTATYVGNVATNASDYTATAHLVYDTANYETIPDPAPMAWGIDQRPASVRSANATWTYDTTTHTKAEVATEGFVAGEGVTARDFASVTDITPAAGVANTFAYDWNAGTRAENYALTVEFGTLRVTPRLIGDDDANWDIRLGKNPTYDGTEKSAPVAQVCYVKPDGNLENIPYTLSGDKATDAGNYVLTITGTGNYAGSVERGWAVMPRHLTLASGSATWTYDGAAHSETAVTVGGDGFAPGEGADYSGFPAPTHVADAAAPGIENVFTWTFRDGAKAGNYEVVATFGMVAVTPRAVTLTAPTKTKPYDGMPLTFDAEEVAVGGEGYAPGEAFALSGFSNQTDAGQCASTFEVASGTALTGDYAITVAEGATLTVTRSAAEIVVQAGSETWTYDGAAHSNRTWTATNLDTLVAGDELSVEFEPDSVATRPTDGPALDGVVSNRIASVRVLRGGVGSADSVDVTANYALSWYPGTLRVTPRPVSLTSSSATKPYDGTPLVAHEVAVGGDGFVGTDGATFSFTGTQTEKGESANAFSWTLKPGTVAAHYEITAVEGMLTVTALDIGGGTNEDWTVELGPTLTYNGIEQVQTVRAATFRGLPVDYAVEDDRATDAGDYALTLVGQGNFSGRWTVPWSIAPKALALTAGSASKVYDGTPITCSDVSATGFVAGEGAQFICAGSRTAVGTSTNAVDEILWDDGTKGSNYAVEKTTGTLTVTPRAVTLTAPTKTKPYDGLPLTFGADEILATLTDGAPGSHALPEGESFAYSDFSAITDAGQCAATFAVAAGPGTDLANYTVMIAPGPTLTVTGSATEITVIADSASWVFDAATHSAPTYTTVNEDTLQPGDALAVTFADGCEVTHTTDGPAGDGVVTNRIASVRVLRDGETDVTRNYTLKTYDGTLRVTKRPVEVRVTGSRVEAVYDSDEHVAEGYGIATDDTLYNLADVAFSGTARAARTDAGTTPMGLAAGDFSNTNADFAVTFAVADGNVAISPADISGGDDGDFFVELGDDPLYNGTVQTVEIRSVTWKGLPVDHTLAGERATHAATYALTVKGTGNFTGERTVRWGIRRRVVTMTSGSAEKVYDATPLQNGAVAVSGDGFIGSEGTTYDVTGSQTAAGSSDNTFSYTLKAGTLAGDYDITTVFGTLTVHKATHDISHIGWSVAADAATFLYDGTEHGVALTGLPSGVTATYESNTATNAGTYTAIANLVYDTANYEPIANPEPLEWSIRKRPITLFAASKDKPYDGWPLEVKPEDITVAGNGYAPGECFTYGDFASITDVGEIPATFSYSDSATAKVANYDVTVQGGQTLKVTVGGDQISVTADSGTWVYDGETHRLASWKIFNGDKLLEGHAFDIEISADSAVTTPAEGVVSNRFDHVRIVEEETGRDLTRNYNLFVYEGELSVTNASIAPTLALHRRVEATYDGQTHSAAVEAPTLLTAATVRYRVGDGAWSATAPEWTHAGDYAAEFEVSAEFYDPCTGRVDVVISPRPVTLSSPTKSKPYDGTPLTFVADEIEASLTSGAPGGRALPEGESFVYSNFASITDAGRIAATFDWAAGTGTLATDYAVTIVPGSLTVNRSAEEISVTAKSGEWVFDGTAHTLHEWTAENLDALVSGDTLEVTFDPESVITEPGEVANAITGVRVMRGTVDVSANYALSWWSGTLKVTKASIAPNMAGANTSGTATYDGAGHGVLVAAPMLLTEPVTVRYAATADGPWAATPTEFTDAGAWTAFFRVEARNYEPYVGTTTMTIEPREVTLVSAGATKAYDGTPLRKNSVSVKVGSLPFVANEGFSATCTGTVTDVGGVENAFDYALTGNAKAGNYTIRKEYGWLRVTSAAMDIAALSAAASWKGPYDGTPHGASLTPPYPHAVVTYALESGNEEAYGPTSPTWTNASTNTVYFKVLAPNYNPGYGAATVTITPRDIALAQIGSLTNEFYTGYPIEPVPTVADTVSMTTNDWTIAWEDNVEAGTGRAVLSGQNNYGGQVVREFGIEYKPVVVVVIDLSNIAVGQGWWGSASLLTNGIAVPEIQPGTRTEITVPTETAIDLAFAPDPGFRIGGIIVDNRLWTTNAVWSFPALKADKSFDAGFLPAPQTTISWQRGGDGRQYATLSFVNHSGYAEALKDLSFLFADKEWRNNGVLTTNMLIDVNSRPRQPTEEHDGATFRRVDFNTTKLATMRDGATVSFGGVNLRNDDGIVRMYSAKRNLDALVGCLAWETNGKRYYQPVVGNGAVQGIIAEEIVTAEKFNQAQALGFDPAFLASARVECRFTDIQFDQPSNAVIGAFEIIAKTRDGIEAESSGLNPSRTIIRLWGADALNGEWRELTQAILDAGGGVIGFSETESPARNVPAQFYKVTIEVDETFE